MHAVIAVVFGLMVSAPVVAEPLVEGWVRRSSGEPVEAAQVLVFDWTDLRRGAVAQATTDAAGYFALPLKSLGGSARPKAWTLGQNYPNPFNPSTIIPYQVSTVARVRLEVFNVLGQRVATLVDEERLAGVHTAVWDATDAAGRAVGAGVYFYRLRSAGHPTLTRRMVLLDGQAGQAAASVPLPQAQATAPSAERVYGLVVTGAGLVTYVDASFGVRSGMAAVEVVVAAAAELPRGKALTDRVLGDVNGDGQVTLDDALLVTTYVVNGSVELPPNGGISLGDVNGDGQVTLDDALLVMTYANNPADASLPRGLGKVTSSGGDWVAGTIRRLADQGGSPSWSPDGQQIVFVSGRDGNDEIYVMDSDGSNPRRLTDDIADDVSPSWSPDGRHIAFVSDRDGNDEIYVMDSDGSNPRRLTDDIIADDVSPSWSPDGRHIAFVSDRNRDVNLEIYVMGSDGSNPRRLTRDGGEDPTWSPDGRHIAFVSDRDIYVMGSDGSNPRRLTRDGGEDPTWSPDGRHIAFVSDRDIYVMGSDGSNPRRLTRDGGEDPTWSPDGRHIAFESSRDIFVIEGSDEGWVAGAIRRLTNYPNRDLFPTWSPDGHHIAFASFRDGAWDIYVMGSDGSNPRNLTNHSSQDLFPSWSPDGHHIVFSRSDDIYVMGSDGSNPRQLTTDERAFYSDRSPSWSPDGRHIVFIGSDDIYVMGSDGSNPRQLTTGERDLSSYKFDPKVSSSWSPDSRHIVFSDNDDIYVMGSDGSNPRRLTDHSARDRFPSWSPDGRHIAFVSDRAGDRVGNFDIYMMNSDGSNPRRLTDHSARDRFPSWSPDGRHIAFVSDRDGDDEIYIIDLEADSGGMPLDDDDSPATANPVTVGESIEGELSARDSDYFRVTVTSAGTLIASTTGPTDTYGSIEDSESNVLEENDDSGKFNNFRISVAVEPGTYYIRVGSKDASSTGPYTLMLMIMRRLTDNIADDDSPSWSPDGRYIAFVSDRGIYVMGSDGSNLRQLTDNLAWDVSPTWSPDGRHIAFVSLRDGNREIYVMGSDGSNQRNLTNRSARDEAPTWSPDGRHIAFQRGGEIYVMGSDGSNPRNLTNHSAWDEAPTWSPDGRHIAFVSSEVTGRFT